MNRVLITGGAGFIGSNLSLALLAKGYSVTVLDNLAEQVHGSDQEKSSLFSSIKNKVRFIKGSVESKDAWREALTLQEVVIHFAAETGTGQSMYDIDKYSRVNIGGTSILFDILANEEHTVSKIMIASSRSIYGEGKCLCPEHGVVYPKGRVEEDMAIGNFHAKCDKCEKNVVALPTDENSKIHPTSFYGITKRVQEEIVMTMAPSLGIAPVSLRYQNVYGPGQSLSNPYTGILSIFSTRMKNGNNIEIFEDGKETRDFVYIDDVISATICSLESDLANGEVFNVGSGIQTNILTVAESLKSFYGSKAQLKISGNYRVGDIRDNFADLNKAKKLLNFEPKILFAEGIKNFCQWVNGQEIKEDGYDKSILEMKRKGLFK